VASLRINDGSSHVGATGVTVHFVDASSDSSGVFVTAGALTDCAAVGAGSFVAFSASTPLTLAAPDGTKTVRACIRDDVDNRRLLTPVDVVLDRAAPSVPGALSTLDQVRSTAIATGGTVRDAQPRLSWSASSDVHGGP